MARAPVSKTGGWGFESLHSCHPLYGAARRHRLQPGAERVVYGLQGLLLAPEIVRLSTGGKWRSFGPALWPA